MPFCFSKDRKLGKMLVLSESLTLFEFSWKQNSWPILWIYLLEALQFKLSTQLWHCLIFQKGKSPCLKSKYQYLIKSYESDEQPNICFRQCIPTYVSLPAKYFFTFVQCFIQLFQSLQKEGSLGCLKQHSHWKNTLTSQLPFSLKQLCLKYCIPLHKVLASLQTHIYRHRYLSHCISIH